MKVLIAEDEPLLRRLLIDKFSRNDCTVISAENGLEPLKALIIYSQMLSLLI
jgi:DNA-binding response OmpR family regulator